MRHAKKPAFGTEDLRLRQRLDGFDEHLLDNVFTIDGGTHHPGAEAMELWAQLAEFFLEGFTILSVLQCGFRHLPRPVSCHIELNAIATHNLDFICVRPYLKSVACILLEGAECFEIRECGRAI